MADKQKNKKTEKAALERIDLEDLPKFEPLKSEAVTKALVDFGYRNALEVKDRIIDDKSGRNYMAPGGEHEKFETGVEYDRSKNNRRSAKEEKPEKRQYKHITMVKDKLDNSVTEVEKTSPVTRYMSIGEPLRFALHYFLSKYFQEVYCYYKALENANQTMNNTFVEDFLNFIENVQGISGSVSKFILTLRTAMPTSHALDETKGMPQSVTGTISGQLTNEFKKVDTQLRFLVEEYLHFVRCVFVVIATDIFDNHATVDRKRVVKTLRLLNMIQRCHAQGDKNGQLSNAVFDDLDNKFDLVVAKSPKATSDPLDDDEDKPAPPKAAGRKGKGKAKPKPAAAEPIDLGDDDLIGEDLAYDE